MCLTSGVALVMFLSLFFGLLRRDSAERQTCCMCSIRVAKSIRTRTGGSWCPWMHHVLSSGEGCFCRWLLNAQHEVVFAESRIVTGAIISPPSGKRACVFKFQRTILLIKHLDSSPSRRLTSGRRTEARVVPELVAAPPVAAPHPARDAVCPHTRRCRPRRS